MKKIKKTKRKVKFKNGLLDIVFVVVPYLPLLIIFGIVNVLLITKFYDETLKVLAGIGLLYTAIFSWRLTTKLHKIIDARIERKRLEKNVDEQINMTIEEVNYD